MGTVLNLQSLFSAKRATPSVDATNGFGHIVQETPMAFLYKGTEYLALTVLHINLHGHASHDHARAVVEGHYGDLEGRSLCGDLYEDRAAYEVLLKNNDTNPRPSYIHALMLEHRGLYFRPETVDIAGYGKGLWFSGLIEGEKGVKTTQSPQPYI